MKTITLLILFFTISTISAQIVNIPDPIFKARLIMEGVDTNNDEEIQVSEAEAVTGMLDVSIHFPEPIYDLTGIEAFINITGLDVSLNQLTTLDLSNNPALIELRCHNNNLTYLNVENSPNIEIINCSQNKLIFLDLKNYVNLEVVHLSYNQLSDLDIRNGYNTNITSFTSSNNPNLICIFVDDAEYSENSPVWFKDPASTYVETQQECDELGIEDISFNKIAIYPNPVGDFLYLSVEGYAVKEIQMELFDISGKMITVELDFSVMDGIIGVDLSSLSQGVYVLKFYNQQNHILTEKLIKA